MTPTITSDSVAEIVSVEEGAESSPSRYYIDCEFDGHDGPLLSLAIVPEVGRGVHIQTTAVAADPWVIDYVVPLMHRHGAAAYLCLPHEVGAIIRTVIGEHETPVIIADSPVDIGRFCRAISTSATGGWVSTKYPSMTFEVHNVDCYPTTLPGAVQHNAWWDAMALRHLLTVAGSETPPPDANQTDIRSQNP